MIIIIIVIIIIIIIIINWQNYTKLKDNAKFQKLILNLKNDSKTLKPNT